METIIRKKKRNSFKTSVRRSVLSGKNDENDSTVVGRTIDYYIKHCTVLYTWAYTHYAHVRMTDVLKTTIKKKKLTKII